jgi:catechol 2,3-dioxygenase-like lactoylglutathione lyase family enzyme
MRTTRVLLVSLAALVCAVASGLGQPADQPLAINHYHLSVRNFDTQKKFWIDMLGGRPGAVIPPTAPGTPPFYVAFPNILVGLIQRNGVGGTHGSTVDHIGFQVGNLRATVDKVKAAGYSLVTRAELPRRVEVKDNIAYLPGEKANVAFVMAPDDITVELIESKAAQAPVAFHHVHLVAAARDVTAMKQWYIKTFGGTDGGHGPGFESVDMPGVPHTFRISPATGPIAPTEGRVLDHFGFEAKDVQGVTKRFGTLGVAMTRPLITFPPNVQFGFITDPWGTLIEVSEHPSGTFFDQSLYKPQRP